jgi:outer membrane receptor for ferrienterochelin and colicin
MYFFFFFKGDNRLELFLGENRTKTYNNRIMPTPNNAEIKAAKAGLPRRHIIPINMASWQQHITYMITSEKDHRTKEDVLVNCTFE